MFRNKPAPALSLRAVAAGVGDREARRRRRAVCALPLSEATVSKPVAACAISGLPGTEVEDDEGAIHRIDPASAEVV